MWLQGEELQTYRSTPTLPSSADTVIIGAGISGVSTAYGLVVERNRTALLLDARGVSGGASGRNSGGVGAGIDWQGAVQQFGLDRATKLLANSNANFAEMAAWISEHCGDAHCDFHINGSVSMYYNASNFAAAAAGVHAQTEAGFGANETVMDAAECGSRMGMAKGGLAGCTFSRFSGTIWASRFVVAIAKRALATSRLNLQTQTRVLSVERDGASSSSSSSSSSPSSSAPYKVTTDRGTVLARHVVFATNAWTAELLKPLHNVIVPVRAQCLASKVAPRQLFNGFDMGADTGDVYGHQTSHGAIVGPG
eukprot:g485.t1